MGVWDFVGGADCAEAEEGGGYGRYGGAGDWGFYVSRGKGGVLILGVVEGDGGSVGVEGR